MTTVFIDRDGVINHQQGFITNPNQLKLIKGSKEAIHLLKQHNIKPIIITNQPQIAKQLCTVEQLNKIHKKLQELLETEIQMYYCPHHPTVSECNCRKPKPGLILQAAKEHNIDLKQSYMIGDKTGDIKAGYLAGCTTILVQTGYGGDDGFKDATPDIVLKDLYEAVQFIIKNKRN